jgi:RNA polymerase sigma-70 factor (ECF subfamily)
MDAEVAALNPAPEVSVARGRVADPDLILRARSGEAEAREELAAHCRRSAYLFALHLVGDPDEALDLAQETVIRLLGALPRFSPERPLRPWLLTIVRNLARDRWRRLRLRRAESLDAPELDLSRHLADPASDPEHDARRAEVRRALWTGLSALPADLREILVLRDYHDLSYAEAAKVLGVPIGTVMSRLHRARNRLRGRLVAERPDLFSEARQGGAGHDD